MIRRVLISALLSALLAVCSPVLWGQNALPSLGDRISGYVTIEQEHVLGRDFLRSIRRSSPAISDPLLNDYLENITYRLASKSELRDHRLAFIIIDSQALNAFAAPGGIIGINTGLFLNANTEGEFASVLSHEIAHVSQRHFARSVEEAETRRIPQLAALLASVVLMASGDAEAGQGALMATQGRALENQLRFSRSNEAEADRIGIQTMYDAGYDPYLMATLFQRLAADNRYGTRPPEFLLSHPVTESRIADSRGRATRYPVREYQESLEYLIMRARVVAHYAPNKKAQVSEYQRLLQQNTSASVKDGNTYGLAVAYWEDKDYAMASATLAPLLTKDPNRISYVVTQAEILTSQNEPGMSIDYLQRHLAINPDNHPLTMTYADALIQARRYQDAVRILEHHSKQRPEDHQLWFLLAETQGQAGNISKVHQARAEYFVLVGDFGRAREQLQYALRLESASRPGTPTEAALRQRVREVEEMGARASG
jgi:beta-barrel assembly-enhancing protease